MDVLTIVLIVALVLAFIIIVSLARRQNAGGGDSILSTLVGWFTTYCDALEQAGRCTAAVRRVQ